MNSINPDPPATRRDLQVLALELKAEFRQEMIQHVRWLAGLFVVQFIATVSAVTGVVTLLR